MTTNRINVPIWINPDSGFPPMRHCIGFFYVHKQGAGWMKADASWGLHRALVKALEGDQKIKAVADIKGPDRGATKPATITMGAGTSHAWHSATFDGEEHRLILELKADEQQLSIRALAALVIERLHDADFPIPGHALIELQFECSETYAADKNGITSCRMFFKALTVSD
ncbi:tail completion protein gp17 [Iodidimonas nitroreducens]|nr:DUF3168 domain-containing protein [Iodidimonas nitroreducens]